MGLTVKAAAVSSMYKKGDAANSRAMADEKDFAVYYVIGKWFCQISSVQYTSALTHS